MSIAPVLRYGLGLTSPDYDLVVVGAGVVGLACAARLAGSFARTLLVEMHPGPGRETSSRNSGVIHAGLYYPTGSLKARLCVEGRDRLYAFCRTRGLPHRRCGKLVVATTEEERLPLEEIARQGAINGAGALRFLGRDELSKCDPILRAHLALHSPESGLVDVHALMDALLADARRAGMDVAFRTRVIDAEPVPTGTRLRTVGPDGDALVITARRVVNAAGLTSDALAEKAGLELDARGLRHHRCKGSYFVLASHAPKPRTELVYPVPSGPGLGIHLTRDLGGRVLAGPDAEYVDRASHEYAVDPGKAATFAAAIARYLPGLEEAHLTPDYAGIRPTLRGPTDPFRDFVIEDGRSHGAPGFLSLLGIESPGLTASLAIAEHVAAMLDDLHA